MTNVLKSGSLKLLEPSGFLMGLCRDYFAALIGIDIEGVFRFLADHHELHHGEETKLDVSKIKTCTCVPYTRIRCLNHPGVPFIVSPSTANFCAFLMVAPECGGSSGHDKRGTFYLSILSLL